MVTPADRDSLTREPCRTSSRAEALLGRAIASLPYPTSPHHVLQKQVKPCHHPAHQGTKRRAAEGHTTTQSSKPRAETAPGPSSAPSEPPAPGTAPHPAPLTGHKPHSLCRAPRQKPSLQGSLPHPGGRREKAFAAPPALLFHPHARPLPTQRSLPRKHERTAKGPLRALARGATDRGSKLQLQSKEDDGRIREGTGGELYK